MKIRALALALLTSTASSTVIAHEGEGPRGVPELDHVFVIVMENHGYAQIIDNPDAPFINNYARSANLGTGYFAVAHPSLTNYLEIVGGSNFGILSDNYPDWHNHSCTPNIISKVANTDNPARSNICPIAGAGLDAETPAFDFTNETQGSPGEVNIDGVQAIPAAPVVGKTIADQLVARSLSWKSYQEDLPFAGPDLVNISDGFYTNNTDFGAITPVLTPALDASGIVALYAAKHNPFVYFKNVQDGTDPRNSFRNIVGFVGEGGLYADLRAGTVPSLSFIAPNQCNDQHGRGNGGPFCNYDPTDDGTQAGLNPALIYRGDVTLQRLVAAIHASRAWREGHSAIVVVWDENDYSLSPNNNRVPVIVETNYGSHGVVSNRRYTHFSLLKTIEGAFDLPCLNHACDRDVATMSDLFGR